MLSLSVKQKTPKANVYSIYRKLYPKTYKAIKKHFAQLPTNRDPDFCRKAIFEFDLLIACEFVSVYFNRYLGDFIELMNGFEDNKNLILTHLIVEATKGELWNMIYGK